MHHRRYFTVLSAIVALPSGIALNGSVALGRQTDQGYTVVREVPDSPAGKRIGELLEIVNSGDRERVKRYILENFAPSFRDYVTMEEHLAVFAQVRNEGEFEFYGVREYEDKTPENQVVVIARNKFTGAWGQVLIRVEPKPPHRITGIRFGDARPPSDLAPLEELTEREAVRELKSFVKTLADADMFSGTFLLAKDGKVLCKGAYGMASKRFNAPNRIDTKFNLGSMNKMFTAVAIAQLVERGKLSFDNPISKYLSTDWLPPEIADKVTIHHLLTHTSGLGSYFTDKFMNSSRALYREIDDYKPIVADAALAFEPGSSWEYSNTGYLLLGAIIEDVTSQSYYDYVRENIYTPAGMTNTDCYEMDLPVPNLAIGYTKELIGSRAIWRNNLFEHVLRGGPAGGGFSTAEDLLKFSQALRSHKLLSPEYTKIVITPKPEANSPRYGYGFVIAGQPGNRIVGHGGGFPGISANMDMFLRSGYTGIVLSNYRRGAAPVDTKIRELLGRVRE